MSDIAQAVEILRRGGLVAFPTETVYGLGADATSAQAVERIFQAKGRPSTNPLIVHVAGEAVAQRYAAAWPKEAQTLAQCFWPGPLTLVLPKREVIVPQATAGRPTVGLRCPDHWLALDLLRAFDGPIAAPSANRSTKVSPTTAQHVADELGQSVDFILDGGPCRVGIESTVLDLTGATPTVLRPGAVTAEEIAHEIGREVQIFSGAVAPSVAAMSPGQHSIHYAPNATAYRFDAGQINEVVRWCSEHLDQSWAILPIEPLAFGNAAGELLKMVDTGSGPEHKLILMPDSPEEYAQRLYAMLRALDQRHIQVLWIELPPDEPRWLAVRDRLMRATKPADHGELKV